MTDETAPRQYRAVWTKTRPAAQAAARRIKAQDKDAKPRVVPTDQAATETPPAGASFAMEVVTRLPAAEVETLCKGLRDLIRVS